MAVTKQEKDQIVAKYQDWVDRSEALIVTEYTGLTVKDIDELRQKARDAGGEFHIIKNTLGKVAFSNLEMEYPDEYFTGSTAIAFAFEDPPAVAKVLSDLDKESDFVSIKGGYLDKNQISAAEIKALANLPALPVLQAQLLSTIMAPANNLARVLAEPARQMAAVIKAYADQQNASAEA